MPSLTEWLRRTLQLATLLSLPVLLSVLLVGIVLSSLAALFRVSDSALLHIPRVLVVVGVLALAGRWGAEMLVGFTRTTWRAMPAVSRHAVAP